MGVLQLILGMALATCGPSTPDEPGSFARTLAEDDLEPDQASLVSEILALTGPPAQTDSAFGIRLALAARLISGHVTVRENQVQGTRLDLAHDLGLDKAIGANADGFWENATLRVEMEVEELDGWGTRTERRPFAWNGTQFSPPAQVRSSSNSLTVLPLLTWKAIAPTGEGFWVGPVVGLEYPYYTVTVTTTMTKGSLEDWVHFLPYPTLGMSGHVEISDGLSLESRITASYLPDIAVPYTEGGRLHVSARPSVRLEIPLVWRLGSAISLSAGFSYQYWSGRDHSNEDGNTLTLSSPGLWVGIDWRF